MPYSDYLQNKIQDLVHRGQAFTAPATLGVALLKCSKGARASTATYAVNDTIAVLANDSKYHLYKCTSITTGISASAQSTLYPGVANEVIVDGGATFTEQSSVLDAGSTAVYSMEPSGNNYSRASVAASLANFTATGTGGSPGSAGSASAGTNGMVANAGSIPFGTPSGNWTTSPEVIWGWAVFDSATAGAGNLLEWGPMNTLQQVLNGQSAPSFAAGALISTLGS